MDGCVAESKQRLSPPTTTRARAEAGLARVDVIPSPASGELACETPPVAGRDRDHPGPDRERSDRAVARQVPGRGAGRERLGDAQQEDARPDRDRLDRVADE